MDMFCRQCEQAAGGKVCSIKGVCGKDAQVSALQDLIIYSLEGIGIYGKLAREAGIKDAQADLFVVEALFATVTNVDFDPQKLQRILLRSYEIKNRVKTAFLETYKKQNNGDFSGVLPQVVSWEPAASLEGLIEQGSKIALIPGINANEDIRSLKELLLYGLKGMAAYADHAYIFEKQDEEISFFFYKGLAALVDDSLTADELVALNMEFGKVNFKCLQLLDSAHTEHFGNPVPTKVSLGFRKGPAIVVSGHDLLDLEDLLKQTEGKGINIYTHGEMLTSHGYPGLNKYKHLAGNYGGAWQDQQKEFAELPGAILMTTNCIQKPADSYANRIFTTGLVAWPGVTHIERLNGKKDFSQVIKRAQELGGFKEDKPGKEIIVGFGHNATLSVANKVIAAVKSGAIKHFFLIGGCDGAKSGRNYYTEFAQKVPKDCVILTLACGKYRFNKLEFGNIGGIPRLLDCGQCNDAYSAIKIALALADAFKCGVNELPLSLILSWYEQKAVCILITLLSLGIKNIKLGPSLPAFVSPNVLKVLVDKFNIAPVGNVDDDLRAALKR